ncbi:hypothetical protein J4434_06640 [Candidatus Woesearchaeota archaeon]|nr:hypothetical protein [Candidatus Woesearchaeota archaeon]
MACNNTRNLTGGLSKAQAKIIMIRGFTKEENLLKQKDFAEVLKKPLTTVNYNIKVLRNKGLLTKLNNLTPDGKVVFQKLKGYLNNTRKLRGHKLSGEFILTEGYRDFELVRNKYLQISKSPKHRGFRVEFEECIVLFYSPQKICFYLPDVYGDSISEIYVEAYEKYISPLKKYLEQMFKGIMINQYEIASVTINHLAYQNHPLAEIFKQFNVRYASNRIEVDHSHGVAEFETIHKKHSLEDMDKILDYEKLIRGSFSCNQNSEEDKNEGE